MFKVKKEEHRDAKRVQGKREDQRCQAMKQFTNIILKFYDLFYFHFMVEK